MGWAEVGEEMSSPILGFDPNSGKPIKGFDPNTGLPVFAEQVQSKAEPSQLSLAGDAVARMGKSLVKSTVAPFAHPLDTMIALGHLPVDLLQAQGAEFSKAKTAYDQGDKGKAALHMLAYLTPVIGPALHSIVTRTQQGQGPEVAGELTSMFAAPAMLSAAAKALPKAANVGSLLRTSNTTPEAFATDWAQAEGVPLSAGAVTDRPIVRAIQKGAQETTLFGSGIAPRAEAAMQQGFATLGDHLAQQTGGRAADLATAGSRATDTLTSVVKARGAEATTAYDLLRGMEAKDPSAFSVDVASAQNALKPLYDQMAASAAVVQPQGAQARALQALFKLMSAPNTAPLSVVDEALGDLKGVLRASGESEPWSRGTGAIAQVVKKLDGEVQAAALRGGGQDALQLLREGRAWTVEKYDAADLLDKFREEPLATARALTAQKDGGIAKLQTLQRIAPEALPDLGNAWLEDLFTQHLTPDAKKFNPGAMFSEWSKLGKGTKQAIFGEAIAQNPNYLHDLDNFFLSMKQASMNPNPSGTASQLLNAGKLGGLMQSGNAVYAIVQDLGSAGLAKALNSPTVVKALTRGLNVPVQAPATRTAQAMSAIVQAFQAAGLPIPVTAQANKDQ